MYLHLCLYIFLYMHICFNMCSACTLRFLLIISSIIRCVVFPKCREIENGSVGHGVEELLSPKSNPFRARRILLKMSFMWYSLFIFIFQFGGVCHCVSFACICFYSICLFFVQSFTCSCLFFVCWLGWVVH